jgi:hypothetical protein
MSILNLYNLNEDKKNFINQIINIYLWGFAISLLLFIIREIFFSNFEIFIFSFIVKTLVHVFIFINPIIIVFIFLVVFRNMYKIKDKLYEKNKISFLLEKYLKIVLLIFFLL